MKISFHCRYLKKGKGKKKKKKKKKKKSLGIESCSPPPPSLFLSIWLTDGLYNFTSDWQ
jgi:hypothetical protein